MEEIQKQDEKSIGKTLDDNLVALEQIVSELSSDKLAIDQAIEKYTQGMELAILCRRNLSNLNQKVMEVRARADLEMSRIKEEESRRAQNPQSVLVQDPKDLGVASSNVQQQQMNGQAYQQGRQQMIMPNNYNSGNNPNF